MKKGMLFMAIFSFAVFVELLSAGSALAVDIKPSNSLSSKYYRIPVVTSDIANLAPSDPRLLAENQLVLSTTDTISLFGLPQTDERKFPDFDTLPGEPPYFAAHWSGSIIVPEEGDYRVTLSSHEASQLFINGAEIISVKPNAELGGVSLTLRLQKGYSNVDIYFAKRSDFQSGLVFGIDGVKFTSSYQENIPTSNIVGHPVEEIVVAEPTTSANVAPSVVYFNPPTSAESGKYFAYKILAQDADSASLSYKLISAPVGMTIAPSTGLILWKPLDSQVSQAQYPVVVAVSDGKDTTISKFEILVKIPVTNSALLENRTNNQVSENFASEPARQIFAENISVVDISEKETSASAGSRLSASVLFAGVFNISNWLTARWLSIFYFFVSMLLAGVVVYVFLEIIDRMKRNKNIRSFAFNDTARQDQTISQMENA